MDSMTTNSSDASAMTSMMIPWLHFTAGDNLFFKSWAPSSNGAIAGACIGLVVIALFERWLFATRLVLENYWRQHALSVAAGSKQRKGKNTAEDSPSTPPPNRTIVPFILKHDLSRGAIHALQSLLGFLLMLAVMSFQAAYIISIVLALGIGEVLFGRMGYIGVRSQH